MGKVVSLVEEEEMEMVPLSGDGQPIKRMGRFLRPRASTVAGAAGVPHVPLLSEVITHGLISWPPKKILFKGWRQPQPKWGQWIEKLKPLYKAAWKKAGICEAIMASTYEVRRDPSLLFGLLVYWCPDTNTFVFPWSEVGVTLEDVMVLGGLPVLGEPVRMAEPLTAEFEAILSRMVTEHKGFRRRSSRKPFHYDWVNYYMEGGKGDHLEHIAFLSLWLSRYVFPASPFDTVGKHVFPVAIRLAQGMRIALAPAVLASIYRDMRVLWQHAISNGNAGAPAVTWAPFQILQLWAWERFVSLRPEERPHFLHWDEPRAARWHALYARLKLSFVRSVLESQDEFQWRPYTIYLDDWCPPSFYKDNSQWITISASKDDDEMGSFARCLRTCELVGLDCIEQYAPHRIAMQFGLDQDLPGCVPRANVTWELAWASYVKDNEEIELYIPPRLFESDVTFQFFNWQKQYMLVRNSLWNQRTL